MLMNHVLCANIKTLQKLKKMLNENFDNICAWFLDNKLRNHLSDDKTKTKSFLFVSKRSANNIRKLNIRYIEIKKQQAQVTYLGYV